MLYCSRRSHFSKLTEGLLCKRAEGDRSRLCIYDGKRDKSMTSSCVLLLYVRKSRISSPSSFWVREILSMSFQLYSRTKWAPWCSSTSKQMDFPALKRACIDVEGRWCEDGFMYGTCVKSAGQAGGTISKACLMRINEFE
jgi:hypothetical protein